MTATLTPVKPADAAQLLKSGRAALIDVRDADEFRRRHIKGAVSRPLTAIDGARLTDAEGRQVIFTCRTGRRTTASCDLLAATVEGEALVLDGGLDAWAAAGLPVEERKEGPIEIMRQVQIAAGVSVLLGVGLGFAVSPIFFGLAGLVGAGLTFSGVTGSCAMASLLALAPWNRPRSA